jgi:hypothetical protein
MRRVVMPYIPNPDTQPGKPGQSNMQAKENQSNRGIRVNSGRRRVPEATGTAITDGANLLDPYGVGSQYSGGTVLLTNSIGNRPTSDYRDPKEVDPKYITIESGDLLGYGAGPYGEGAYGT